MFCPPDCEILKSKDGAFFFFFFWLLWVFIAARRLSLVAASGEFISSRSARACHRGDLSCWRAQILGQVGFGSCGSRLDHRLSNCRLRFLVAPQHVESSWTRDQTHVPCVGRQTPNHWTTRGVLYFRLITDNCHCLVPLSIYYLINPHFDSSDHYYFILF